MAPGDAIRSRAQRAHCWHWLRPCLPNHPAVPRLVLVLALVVQAVLAQASVQSPELEQGQEQEQEQGAQTEQAQAQAAALEVARSPGLAPERRPVPAPGLYLRLP